MFSRALDIVATVLSKKVWTTCKN